MLILPNARYREYSQTCSLANAHYCLRNRAMTKLGSKTQFEIELVLLWDLVQVYAILVEVILRFLFNNILNHYLTESLGIAYHFWLTLLYWIAYFGVDHTAGLGFSCATDVMDSKIRYNK